MTDVLRPDEGEALAEWARRVRANYEQSGRVREPAPPRDFYAPVAANFRADPRRTDEPMLDVLRSLVRPDDTWLDIGAGGGRYALPIALLAREVVALDHSESMLGVLTEAAADEGIANVRVVQGSWPASAPIEADAALMSHVGYDIEEIGPFLEAMERSARRLCVAVFLAEAPATAAAPYWPPVHGEERHLLPALPEFLALQLARGVLCDVRVLEREPMAYHDRDGLLRFLRMQLFLAPGSEKDQKLQALVAQAAGEGGRWTADPHPKPLGIVTWRPRR